MGNQPKEPQKVKKPHDIRLKELFGNKGAFISLLKDCVKAEWADRLDRDSLRRSETSFILQDYKGKEADIVYEATLDKGRRKVVFYVLLELQSRVDYTMPYRLLLYIVEILRYYYNGADAKARKRKGFRFPAVIPIVFYGGSSKWTAPANLREIFDGHSSFGGSLLDFSYALVDAKGYDSESVKGFGSRLLRVMMMFEKSKNVAELIEVIERHERDIKQLDEEELRILKSAITILGSIYGASETKKLSEALETASAERVGGMLSNLVANEKKREREWLRQGIEQGIEQGVEQGIEQGVERGIEQGIELEKTETAKALLAMGLSVDQVAKGTRLPIEEVERIRAERTH